MSIEQAKSDLEASRREIARLENLLRVEKERETKIAHYIEMAATYGAAKIDAMRTEMPPHRRILREPPQSGMSAKVVSAAVSYLRETGHPAKTRVLLPIIEEKGYTIGGRDPVAGLSSILSRSGELVADRTVGWRLAEWVRDSHPQAEDNTEEEPMMQEE